MSHDPPRLCVTILICLLTQHACCIHAPLGLEDHPQPHEPVAAQRLHLLALSSARRVERETGYSRSHKVPPLTFTWTTQQCRAPSTPPPAILPTSFGADPTGVADSSDAFVSALRALMNVSHSNLPMASGIRDLGGATLDLAGGDYLISKPLALPDFHGNFRIRGGTLRASRSFPPNRFLVEIGSEQCEAKDKQNVCSEFVGLDNIFLDASHVAAGCVKVSFTMGTTIGSSAFCTGFVDAGIRVVQGHETMIQDSWLAAYYWNQEFTRFANVAIELDGEDNYVTNVIVFNGGQRTAVLINGAANVLSGVHTWGGSITINGSYDIQDRVLGCYIDYNVLEIVNPNSVIVQDNFFYNGHARLHGSKLRSLVFRENIYSLGEFGGNLGILVAEEVQASNCEGVVIEDEINGETNLQDWRIRSTRAHVTIQQQDSKLWIFNFTELLLFPWIDQVQYSVTYGPSASLQLHGARKITGAIVHVEFAQNTNATVTMEVVQCPYRFGSIARSSSPQFRIEV